MEATLTLLDLAGYIAMLLWGLHMVQSGIMQAFGTNIRHYLSLALKNRVKALFAGLTATMLLQSATAVSLMTSSLTARGLIDLVPALALMLGANIGTTFIVQLLSFNISHIAPAMLLIGVIGFRYSNQTLGRNLSSSLIGIALMLFSLKQMLLLLQAAEQSEGIRLLLNLFSQDYLLNMLLGAVLTWATHSSVAVVLLTMSFSTQNLISLKVAFALVLGANLGGAINPLFENVLVNNPASRRLPLGNLINRLTGCILVLPFFSFIDIFPNALGSTPVHAIANFHTWFNIIMACLFFPILKSLARLLNFLLREQVEANDPERPHYLDAKALDIPEIAIANAAREALRITDIIEKMLTSLTLMLEKGNRDCGDGILRSDDVLNRLSRQIEIYISSLHPQHLTEEDKKRAYEVLTFVINMRYASGIIANGLIDLAVKKIEQHMTFSQEDWDNLHSILQRVTTNARLASTVFMAREPRLARQLLDEKIALRDQELQAKHAHFNCLQEGGAENIEISALQLDILSNLKRINSYFASSVLSVLYEQGKIPKTVLNQSNPPPPALSS